MRIVILNDTSNGHLGCNLVMDILHEKCRDIDLNITASIDKDDVRAGKKQVIRKIRKSDLVIINGEGTFHHCSNWAEEYLELSAKKPTFLINTVWDKVYIDRMELVKNLDLISVREGKSYNQLKEIVNEDKLFVVPDLSFYLPKFKDIDKTGYGDSVMNTLRGTLKKKDNYFPFAPGSTTPSIEAYFSWLESLNLYVTGRFHGVCLASMTNTPFLAFPSNCHKIESLLVDMDCEELLISSFDEIEEKEEKAKELIEKAHNYASNAPNRIGDFFIRMQQTIKEL